MFVKLFNILLLLYSYVCLFVSIYFYNIYYSVYKYSYLKNKSLFSVFYKYNVKWRNDILKWNSDLLKFNMVFSLNYLLLFIVYLMYIFLLNFYYWCSILIFNLIIYLLLNYKYIASKLLNKFIYFIILYYTYMCQIYLLNLKQLKIKPNFFKHDYMYYLFPQLLFFYYSIFFNYYFIYIFCKKSKNNIYIDIAIRKVIMRRKLRNYKIKLQNISILNILFIKFYVPLLQKLQKYMFWKKVNRKKIRIFIKSSYYRIKWKLINLKKKIIIKINELYTLFLYYLFFYIFNPYFNFLLKNKANNIFFNFYLSIKYAKSFCVWIVYKITKKRWKK